MMKKRVISHPSSCQDTDADIHIKTIEEAREFANAGKLKHAHQLVQQLLKADRENPELYHLLGTILSEMEAYIEAEESFKKTLYLDPNYVMTHFEMISICRKLGKEKQASKHEQNIIDILLPYQNEYQIPGSLGLSAGDLRSIISSSKSADHE